MPYHFLPSSRYNRRMYPWESITYCPKCGEKSSAPPNVRFECGSCRFVLFFNPAIGVAGIVVDEAGNILMLRRQRDPHKGKLGIPGGFVDHGEAVDEALRREIQEETGLTIDQLEYLASYPNEYEYAGITYQISDVFYVVRVQSFEKTRKQVGEVEELLIVAPHEVRLDEMAFHSNRLAIQDYLATVAQR